MICEDPTKKLRIGKQFAFFDDPQRIRRVDHSGLPSIEVDWPNIEVMTNALIER